MISILTIAIIFAAMKFVPLLRYRVAINEIIIENVDVSELKDGIYRGRKEAVWVAAEVEVIIKNHRIEDIKLLEHQYGREQAKEAEVVIDRVLKEQRLDVDIVSGSTSSSKVILEAVETALLKIQ